MSRDAVEAYTEAAVQALRSAGARFGYLHGSRSGDSSRPESDIDVAAYFGDKTVVASDILLPPTVDLMVLDSAPLELAGRVATDGKLLFEVDPAARVRWEATTRKIYFDERPRFERSHREFLESLHHG